jgi:hypothetical protein
MIKCPFCGQEIQKEAIRCRYCGRRLVTKPANGNSDEQLKIQEKLRGQEYRQPHETPKAEQPKDYATDEVLETARDGRFIAYDNGTVLDTESSLMWAATDNGSDINWQLAKRYCEHYQGGGYSDWRMPTQDELSGLYDNAKTYMAADINIVHLTSLIRITSFIIWASETADSDATSFSFYDGSRSQLHESTGLARALPVRFYYKKYLITQGGHTFILFYDGHRFHLHKSTNVEKQERPDEVALQHQSEKPPFNKGKKQNNRFSLIISWVGAFTLIVAFMLILISPTIIDDTINYINSQLISNRPSVKSVMVSPLEDIKLKDQTESISVFPAPSSVTKEASMEPDAQPTAISHVPSGSMKKASEAQNAQPIKILPIGEKKSKGPTKEISQIAPPKVTKKGKYAIQIIAYPEARKNDALAFAKELRKTQPNVYVERVYIQKRGVWYRVLMGHFTSIEYATNYMKEKKILETHPGSFIQLKSEGQSRRKGVGYRKLQ